MDEATCSKPNGKEGSMANRLKEMGHSASWRLLVKAAVEGARNSGFDMKRQPGRGLSNTWEAMKDGETQIASIRTTRDRAIAFVPLDDGKRWKTLDDVDLVIVSAADDYENPQHVDVYIFPAEAVRARFSASYAARIESGHTISGDFGMWLAIDAADTDAPLYVGSGLANEFPAIARYSIDELEGKIKASLDTSEPEGSDDEDEIDQAPAFRNVSDVLAWARQEIARLSGMPSDAIKLDLKIEA